MHAFVVGGVNGGETTNPRKLIVSTSEIIQIPEAKTHQQNHGPIKDLNYHMALPTKTRVPFLRIDGGWLSLFG